jgi:uncharacterized protein (AIM24 family)
VGGLVAPLLADEAVFRPAYFGTGVMTLESSLGGFHLIDLNGESWILERGVYWASEGSVDVSYHRERLAPATWAREGHVYLQTRVRGHGKVVLTTRGPVEEVVMRRGRTIAAEAEQVIARTDDVSFKIGRSTENSLARLTAGERLVRLYEGTGRILLNPAQHWKYRVAADHRRRV